MITLNLWAAWIGMTWISDLATYCVGPWLAPSLVTECGGVCERPGFLPLVEMTAPAEYPARQLLGIAGIWDAACGAMRYAYWRPTWVFRLFIY